jgi:hypothetical protein
MPPPPGKGRTGSRRTSQNALKTKFAEFPTGEVRRIPKMRSSENAVPFSHMTSLGTIAQPSYCSLTHTLLAYWRKL